MPIPDECDCLCEPEPRCPYCGHEQSDFWETSRNKDSDGDHDCDNCSRRFRWSCMVSIEYSTRPVVGPHRLSEFDQKEDAEENPAP